MLNDDQWPSTLDEFKDVAQALLGKLDECLIHLELICNDADAAQCLVTTLERLVMAARALRLEEIAAFAQQIHEVLRGARPQNRLHGETLRALHQCLALLAWQLELIDPRTGQLCLDDEEQVALIGALAATIDPQHA